MTRLIDADALKKAMDGYWGTCQRIRKPRNGETAVFLDVRATVEKQPIIDAVPVRHGKWMPKEIIVHNCYAITGFNCSVCGEEALSDCGHLIFNKTNFCPNCGARMDAE